MKINKTAQVSFAAVMVLILVLACAIPTGIQLQFDETATPNPAETGETEPIATSNPDNNSSESTSEPAAEEPTQAAPTATLAHSTIPSGPGTTSSFVTDSSSKNYAAEKQSPIEDFFNLLFERPFTSETMDYKGYVDITRGELSVGSPFMYVTIFLEDVPPPDSNAHYGIEIDLDRDGRGDWLVYGRVPAGTDWTVEGVKVYTDTNNDVGGATPIKGDGVAAGLDGYDSLVFNEGYDNPDPDVAWVRRNPGNPQQVQLAFKLSVLGTPGDFLWGVWADDGVVNPAQFDYNDHFTLESAGSPVQANSNYPVKALPLLDNSCRWTYGFTAVSPLPGLCYIPPTPTPTPSPTPILPGTITGGVYYDYNFDGDQDGGESGQAGWTIQLGKGACNSSGAGSTVTDGSGAYTFSNLDPGTYCVTLNITLSGCGWQSSNNIRRTVNVGNGQTKTPDWFGIYQTICN